MKIAGMITGDVDPAAFFELANRYLQMAGRDATLALADLNADYAKAMGVNGKVEQQIADVLFEAVQVADARKFEAEQTKKREDIAA